jgi:hypothetical protein
MLTPARVSEIVKIQLRVEQTRKEYDEECVKHDAFQAIATRLVAPDESNRRVAPPSFIGDTLGTAAARAAVLETLQAIQARKAQVKEQLKQDLAELSSVWEKLWEKLCKAVDQRVAKGVEERFRFFSGTSKFPTKGIQGVVSVMTMVDSEDGTTRKSRRVSFEDERRTLGKELEAKRQLEERLNTLEKRIGEKGWARASRVAALEKQNAEVSRNVLSISHLEVTLQPSHSLGALVAPGRAQVPKARPRYSHRSA